MIAGLVFMIILVILGFIGMLIYHFYYMEKTCPKNKSCSQSVLDFYPSPKNDGLYKDLYNSVNDLLKENCKDGKVFDNLFDKMIKNKIDENNNTFCLETRKKMEERQEKYTDEDKKNINTILNSICNKDKLEISKMRTLLHSYANGFCDKYKT